ncbi:type III secretion system outer membrane ring subunit SctC [Alcaligenes sp. WGS1538]|uniref:type III secretion system outer membrane ring subunit SctC n=1 Tax=Alcaligenes sp. WGS1538 TaxID=3366811 RepID=UPI00372D3D30
MKHLIPACALALCLAGTAQAAPNWPAAPYSYYAQDESLQNVLRQFAGGFSLALQLAPGVSGTVNGKFNTATPSEFLDRLGGVYGFNWFVHAGTLFVSPASAMVTKSVSASGGSISALREALLQLGVLDPRFGWGELADQGIALVSGPPAYVSLIQKMIEALPLGSGNQQVAVFRLKHASVNDREVSYRSQSVVTPGLATVLRNLILGSGASNETLSAVAAPLRQNPPTFTAASDGAANGQESGATADAGGPAPQRGSRPGLRFREPTVEADPRLNAIIVQDIPDRIPIYKELIEQLDVPNTLIEIEAMIVDVNSDDVSALGVTWGARAGTTSFGYGDFNLSPSDGLPLGGTSAGTLSPGTFALSVSNVLAARLQALETKGAANILSQPSILTADNMGALIDLSDTFFIPISGERVAEVTPITVGTSLRVTPRYIEGDHDQRRVELTVDIEDGRIQDERSINNLPTVRKSNISTLAIVGDGQTLLIGGYNSSQDSQRVDKVPVLGDIPLLGALFSNKNKTVQRRERLFLLRPRIVSIQGEPVTLPRLQSADTGPAISATWPSDGRPMSAGQYLDLIRDQQTRVRFDAVIEAKMSGPVRVGPTYIQSTALGKADLPSDASSRVMSEGAAVQVQTRPVRD